MTAPIDYMASLSEFHERHGSPPPQIMDSDWTMDVTEPVNMLMAQSVIILGRSRAESDKDNLDVANRLFRIHLMMEELAEVIEAFGNGDEVKVADGLTDLLYVTVGSALSYSIDINHTFREVHRSNMTKRPKAGDEQGLGGDRIEGGDKAKGDTFSPPRIREAINQGRQV